ncbi:hypothetical protein HZH66_014797 [Vespula vulgaris]|uniref:Uncharacterized protein n=1 Tax=Vespula vulgaris TaxID=7454 RepID=A0A834J5J4_VESVU|nr:hypothetical protein HZH66_014797 [Vespula vulgaris]
MWKSEITWIIDHKKGFSELRRNIVRVTSQDSLRSSISAAPGNIKEDSTIYKLHFGSWGSWNIARCNNDFTRKRVPPCGTHNEQELSIVCAKSKDVWSTIRCNLAEHHGATIIIEIRVKSDKSNVAVSFFLSSDFATNYN